MSEDAPITLSEEQQSEVQALLQQGQKIEAVKLCRELMDCDLVQAKSLVDELCSEESAGEAEEAEPLSVLSPLGILVLIIILSVYLYIR